MGRVTDVAEDQFQTDVVERSDDRAVVVDFWAEWCGPCRTLGPALQSAIAKRGDQVELAKVDVDANQGLAQYFSIQGIPAVKAIRDRRVIAEFSGAISPAQIEQFLDSLEPSEADRLIKLGDVKSLREALKLEPGRLDATLLLSRILVGDGESAGVAEMLTPLRANFSAAGILARLELGIDGELAEAYQDWDRGRYEPALQKLDGELTASADDPQRLDLLRQVMVAIFTELGADHPLAREYRKRLAAALP